MSLFHPRSQPVETPPRPTLASEARGKGKPTAANLAGIQAANVLNSRRNGTWEDYVAAQEARVKARNEAEDLVMAKVAARQAQAVG